MQIILHDNNIYMLKFSKGEEVIQGLLEFAAEKKITAAHINALGACSETILSYYNLEKKEYHDRTLYEDMEIVSVTGNIGQMDGKPVIHAHGVFSDSELETHGGHIKSCTVSATCEVTVTVLNGELIRKYDDETGLNLLI